MIVTLTLNPSIDYVVHLPTTLQGGCMNRVVREVCLPGGKGVNVSRVLKSLGQESVAMGFCAGFTGEAFLKDLEERGIHTDFLMLQEGFSRINVKVKGAEGEETEINGNGPQIPREAVDQLLLKLENLKNGDVLVLAGSIPGSLPDTMYEEILERVKGKGILSVVDATGELLKKTLPWKPFLIKPNREELEELAGRKLKDDREVEEAAGELQAQGAGNVLVSMAKEGAFLLTAQGKSYRVPAARGCVVNSVGAGDSMVAGFLTGYLQTGDAREALLLGSAAGAATAFSEDLAEGEKIQQIYRQYKVSLL